jgi:Polysaccharide lyase
MATDTSKITGAADELSAGLAKGGTAAKTLGAEIATAIKSLDSRVAALESGSVTPPDPGDTGGLVTEFTNQPNTKLKIDGRPHYVWGAGRDYGIRNPDPYSLRFEVHQGDKQDWDGGGYCERSQIDAAASPYCPVGGIATVGCSFMFEPGSPNGAPWFVIHEMHNDDPAMPWPNKATSPPVVLELNSSDRLCMVIRHCPSNKDPSNAAGNLTLLRPWTASAAMQRGKWYKWKWEVKNSNDGSGYCKMWIDDQQVANYTGPCGYGYRTYHQCGIYRESRPEIIAATFKNIVAKY